MNIVRTVGIFMALAALSFVLGFFVLARLIPGSTKPAMAATLAAPGGDPSVDTHALPPAQPAVAQAADRRDAPTRAHEPVATPAPAPGPSLDPSGDAPVSQNDGVQKARPVDDAPAHPDAATAEEAASTPKGSASSRATAEAAPAPKTRRRHELAAHKRPAPADAAVGRTASARPAPDEPDTPVEKTVRPSRSTDDPADGQDKPAGETGGSERTTKGGASDLTTANGPLFHVHLGAYHSREAAEKESQRANEKGFATRVVPINRSGRTLYRVQAGAFRERTRAESVRQSLQDASLDATVTEQGR